MSTPPDMETVHITTCPHDCGGRCLLKVHVQGGIVRRIETDDGEEPQLRACAAGVLTVRGSMRRIVCARR